MPILPEPPDTQAAPASAETPIHARDTLPAPANDDGEPPPPIIPAGFARHALRAALDDAYRALGLLAATADAVARQLDGETP